VGERVRTIAESEHRDLRRQIEKIIIDAVRNATEENSKREPEAVGVDHE
jgi:phage regulator Rha-like protein